MFALQQIMRSFMATAGSSGLAEATPQDALGIIIDIQRLMPR